MSEALQKLFREVRMTGEAQYGEPVPYFTGNLQEAHALAGLVVTEKEWPDGDWTAEGEDERGFVFFGRGVNHDAALRYMYGEAFGGMK